MKTLYIDCGMGAAGDMLTAALLELVPDPEAFLRKMNALGIPGTEIASEPCGKCGIRGTRMTVKINGKEEQPADECSADHEHDRRMTSEHEHGTGHEHDHEMMHDHDHTDGPLHGHAHSPNGMKEITEIVRKLSLPEKAEQDVLAVYGILAEAESRAHGVDADRIHFSEVGLMDAVADITAVSLLIGEIAPDQIISSPVHVGSGQIRCAHGILPVPAPATANILKGIPIYGGAVRGELCTPTGAALLKHFADSFGDMPVMKTEKIGYGMGTKDFEWANCVRVMLGETEEPGDTVSELLCNVDDMTPEEIGFAEERFFEAGALEVYTTAVGMKKSRPGILLSVMCREDRKEEMIRLIFRCTTTIGIRETVSRRYTLRRRTETAETSFGPVRKKISEGYGTVREKYEYEDLSAAARKNHLGLREAKEQIDREQIRNGGNKKD
jgi:uncharacterized protein (TIGR00299 family) protein